MLALMILWPTAAAAQESEADLASPHLPFGHWAIDAVRRLDALGMIEQSYDPGFRSLTQLGAARIFLDAVLYAEVEAPVLATLVRGYRARYRQEFPSAAAAADGLFDDYYDINVSGFVGHQRETGIIRSGEGYQDSDNWTDDADWTGPRRLDDISTPLAQIAATRALGTRFAVDVRVGYRDNRWKLDETHLTAQWNVLGAWIGRRAVGYGPGVGGSLVLSGGELFDGVGVFLARPVHLPWFFEHVGPIHFETFVSRMEENTPFRRPWFWGARGSASPHPRLTLGVSRGAFFGGEGNAPITLGNIASVLIGKHAGAGGEFDMQVVAVDVRYRPPLGALPISLYLEWGLSDSAGAWRDVPATLAGVEVAALPRIPWLAVGIERTAFSRSCCGNPIWYRNWSFWGGWTDDGRPLGHPLAGHGTEWLAHAAADLFDAKLRVNASAFVRNRGEENLYAPDRSGRSRGGAASVRLRLGGMDVVGEAELDDGDGWRESRLRGGIHLIL